MTDRQLRIDMLATVRHENTTRIQLRTVAEQLPSVDDAKAAAELFARLEGQPMGKVRRMYADNKYHNYAL